MLSARRCGKLGVPGPHVVRPAARELVKLSESVLRIQLQVKNLISFAGIYRKRQIRYKKENKSYSWIFVSYLAKSFEIELHSSIGIFLPLLSPEIMEFLKSLMKLTITFPEGCC